MGLFSSSEPPLTEANLSDQSGKTFLITGATSGYGMHLASILYQHGGKVYLAARNASRGESVINNIMKRFPESKGQMVFLQLDLGDLSTIKKSADEFLTKESKLHVLWNNAGVMIPPQGSTTAQGYELQLGTNVVGPFLFTKLLYPALVRAAADSPPNSVRVVWLSSSAVRMAPTPAIDFSNMDYRKDEGAWTKYARSKAANILLAVEFARRSEKDGVGSITLDPGTAMTDLQRTMPCWQVAVVKLIAQPPEVGAYTELYAGLQPEIESVKSGKWIVPPGKVIAGRKDLFDVGLCEKFWQWNEEQIRSYL
ncbi:putative short-chain dehydrogenase [Aspergillus nomiae NRRL 13137]|uniref:Putative short-chain dehydrogenase n=1 Tax=Aspergillus nomiae NRRL (strain ATCC 15546 / NRRL 13137 / CBS 260.88 / M93) TaxID=1509407 RepID=A0A0L1IXE0_ASPN3|nr:putative short-chain dehydrogenase [Aspergillus nomiae NRRL 13137]KNG83843.1 putative short-chain dehydrogenase [Aspergillus nomiae NRRL 13137]